MSTELPFVSLEDLVGHIPDGALLAVPKDESGVAMAATRALVRRGVRDLHLLCVPTSGLQADILIGSGCVSTLECGAVTLDEFGLAPRFREAVETGAIRMVDSTCPAIYAALQAGEKGSPFASMRGIIGSDVERHRDDWRIMDNPFSDTSDPVLLVPAIRPDIALFHARLGDRNGNVWVGNKRELIIMAHAAKSTLVTVEGIYDGDLVTDERYGAGTIAALYVNSVAQVKKGAWPLAMPSCYGHDPNHLKNYAAAARTVEGFADYMNHHVLIEPTP
ncbi:MAG: CoA synthetase [Rhodospirillaceae bacterium]|jgi:glutaconate CoA-transferase subunit A|nr:CoA synthetase [Rhodospirillaceae bacterium]